jgi:flagellar hook-associated protein 3 FlgL
MISTSFTSTTSLSDETRRSIARLQASLIDAQKELSSGRHADVGVTLGASTGITVSMRQDLNQIKAIEDTNNIVLTRMQASQASLQTISTKTQDFLSALVGAQSSSTSPETILQEAQAGMQTLQGQLNSSLDGQFLFAGINSDVKPMGDFFSDPPSASAQAVVDAFHAKFGIDPTDPTASSISAADMKDFLDNEFADLFSATNWSANWSAASDKPVTNRISRTEMATTSVTANDDTFRTLTQAYAMVTGLGFANLNPAAQQAIVHYATELVVNATSVLIMSHSFLGVTQQRVTDSNNQIDTQVDFLTKSIDNLESVDPVVVTTQISTLTTQLEAAYSLTNRLNNLSLMDYLTPSS